MADTKHFILVHGFGHGAWCWYKLVALLKSKGHKVSALDMGGCGLNTTKASCLSDYLQPLMDFMAALDKEEKVVLVGHSYGGIPISLAMESFPEKVSMAVFVTAYMPNCEDPPATLVQEFFKRSSTESIMDSKMTFDQGLEKLPTSASFGPNYMASTLYQYCSEEDLELAKMLIRPGSFYSEELGKKSLLSNERYGKIRRCYVVCKGDEVMNEEFQMYNIENSPPDEVVSIANSGHMVMLSKTQELGSCLLKLATCPVKNIECES